jgi:hypothetical protein
MTLALGQTRGLAHLGLHDRLGEKADALPQDVDLTLGAHLAQGLERGHAVVLPDDPHDGGCPWLAPSQRSVLAPCPSPLHKIGG